MRGPDVLWTVVPPLSMPLLFRETFAPSILRGDFQLIFSRLGQMACVNHWRDLNANAFVWRSHRWWLSKSDRRWFQPSRRWILNKGSNKTRWQRVVAFDGDDITVIDEINAFSSANERTVVLGVMFLSSQLHRVLIPKEKTLPKAQRTRGLS